MNLTQASRALQDFFRASTHAQAPWRAQRQWVGAVLLLVTALGMTAALYLDVTSRAAIAGRQIQALRSSIVATQLVNADLQSRLAESTSTASMEARALALGYEPVDQADLQYLPVPGYSDPEPLILAQAGSPKPSAAGMPSEYTESLFDWIGQALERPIDPAWGIR